MGMIQVPNSSIEFFKENLDNIFNSGNLAESSWNDKIVDYTKKLTGCDYALPTNSNGAGLVGLISLYRYYHNRKNVLIQENTMYGVQAMVYAAGCNHKGSIECRLDTLMPSKEHVIKSIGLLSKEEKKETIIMLSHIGGIINPDIVEIAQICKDENIILLEDCAHSFASTLNGEHSGLFGDAGVYSFYATKAIPVGEGGIVVTKNENIGKMIIDFSIYDRFEQKLKLGNNIRISEVQALLTYSVMKEWKTIIKNKRDLAKHYVRACDELNIPYIHQETNGQKGNYYKFIIFDYDKPIRQKYKELVNITSGVYDYSLGIDNSDIINKHACLPIWYRLDIKVVKEVISQLRSSI
jgi:perosamine synthetase